MHFTFHTSNGVLHLGSLIYVLHDQAIITLTCNSVFSGVILLTISSNFGHYTICVRLSTNACHMLHHQLHVGASHWVCTTSIGATCGEVLLMDRLASSMRQKLILQDAQMYGIPFEKSCLIIQTLDVQQQNGCKGCGVFSIAFAAELCSGNDPRKAYFIQSI